MWSQLPLRTKKRKKKKRDKYKHFGKCDQSPGQNCSDLTSPFSPVVAKTVIS